MPNEVNNQLFYHEAGSLYQPAILFLHGSPLSGRMWKPQLEQLNEFHCLAPDLPGHGRSAQIPLDMPSMVQNLTNLILSSTSSGKAHVVGLSFGGVVAQALMVARPEVVDHVILSGTSTLMNKWLVNLSMLNEPVLRILPPHWLATLLCIQFGIPSRYRTILEEDFKAFSSNTLFEVMKTYLSIEIPSKTKSPTLIVVGQKETAFAKWAARKIASSIPGSKGVVVPNCGHVWNMESPELFTETVRAWFKGGSLPIQLRAM